MAPRSGLTRSWRFLMPPFLLPPDSLMGVLRSTGDPGLGVRTPSSSVPSSESRYRGPAGIAILPGAPGLRRGSGTASPRRVGRIVAEDNKLLSSPGRGTLPVPPTSSAAAAASLEDPAMRRLKESASEARSGSGLSCESVRGRAGFFAGELNGEVRFDMVDERRRPRPDGMGFGNSADPMIESSLISSLIPCFVSACSAGRLTSPRSTLADARTVLHGLVVVSAAGSRLGWWS